MKRKSVTTALVAFAITLLFAFLRSSLQSYLHGAGSLAFAVLLVIFWPALMVLGSVQETALHGVQGPLAFLSQFFYLWALAFAATTIRSAYLGLGLALGVTASLLGIIGLGLAKVLVGIPLLVVWFIVGLPWNLIFMKVWSAAARSLGSPHVMGWDWDQLWNGVIYGGFIGGFVNGAILAAILAWRSSKGQPANEVGEPRFHLVSIWVGQMRRLRAPGSGEDRRAWFIEMIVPIVVTGLTIGAAAWIALLLWDASVRHIGAPQPGQDSGPL